LRSEAEKKLEEEMEEEQGKKEKNNII